MQKRKHLDLRGGEASLLNGAPKPNLKNNKEILVVMNFPKVTPSI